MKKMVDVIVEAIENKQGKDIKVLDFHNVSALMDYFVITHGDSNRQLQAIIDGVETDLLKSGYKIKSIQGSADGGWILLDAFDVIVHVFSKEQRDFYSLERLWADLPEYKREV